MADLPHLLSEKQRLEAEIAAAKPQAVAAVFAYMEQLGVTLADMGAEPVIKRRGGTKRPVKYRDEKGNTWTGVGQRPRWLRAAMAAGATLEQFAVRRDQA